MRKYYSGKILFCGTVLRRYVSQNIVAISGTLRLNRFTLLYVHYLIDRFSQLLRCEVVSHFINTWDIRYLLLETTSSTCWFPVSRDFYVRTFVKFTFANNYRGNVWKVARKRKSRNSLNFTFNLNTLQTLCLASTFFTWLKFTCVKYVFVSDVFIRYLCTWLSRTLLAALHVYRIEIPNLSLFRNRSVHEFYRLKVLITLEHSGDYISGRKKRIILMTKTSSFTGKSGSRIEDRLKKIENKINK